MRPSKWACRPRAPVTWPTWRCAATACGIAPELFLRLIVPGEAPYPDVAVPDRVVVILQCNREFGIVGPVPGNLAIDHRAHQFLVEMDQDRKSTRLNSS